MGYQVYVRKRTNGRGAPAAFRVVGKNRTLHVNRKAQPLLAGSEQVLIIVDREAKKFGLVPVTKPDPKGVRVTGQPRTGIRVGVGDLFNSCGIEDGLYLVNLEETPGGTAIIASWA